IWACTLPSSMPWSPTSWKRRSDRTSAARTTARARSSSNRAPRGERRASLLFGRVLTRGDARLLRLLLLQPFRQQEGQLQRLSGVQPRVAAGVVLAGEVGFGDAEWRAGQMRAVL